MQHFGFCSHLSKGLFLSNNLQISVSEHFFEVIHPPHRCGRSLIRQHDYCTGEPQAARNQRPLSGLKFYWISGSGNQAVSGVSTVCPTQCRVHQVADRGLWSVGPLLFNSCSNWKTPSYTHGSARPVSVQVVQPLGWFQLPGVACRRWRRAWSRCKAARLRAAFYCVRLPCALITLWNQHGDGTHLWKSGEMLTDPHLDRFRNNIWKK